MQTAVYKRDFISFFNNKTAYIIFVVYSLLSSVMAFFWGNFFTTYNASMTSFFIFQPNILAIIIPAISMRSWADEKRSGTVENLLTFPLSSFNLVMSKFFAIISISFIMILFSLPLLVTSAIYIPIDYGSIFCAYLALILISMVLSAYGCLVSSLVSTPAVAYLLSLLGGVLWINFNFGGAITSLLHEAPFYFDGILNFSNNYQNLLNGQFNFYSTIYFISFTLLLLFYNLLVVDNWRAK